MSFNSLRLSRARLSNIQRVIEYAERTRRKLVNQETGEIILGANDIITEERWKLLIENGITGYTFPCGDIEDLAGRMAELAADKNKLKDMGKRAYERIQNYSVEKAVEGKISGTSASP